MINEEYISVASLSPIQFREPVGLDEYPEQHDFYVPKIGVTDDLIMQFIGAVELLNQTVILALVTDKGYRVLTTELTFTETGTGSGIYYANATFTMGELAGLPKDTIAYFELHNDDMSEIFAKSIWYKINPSSTSTLKKLSYVHYKNDWNIQFNGTTFNLWVECGYIPSDIRNEQDVEDFEQQNMTNEILYGDTSEVMPITFGGVLGIPYWMARKVDMATLCSTVKLDGKEIVRIKGAKIEKTEATKPGLGVYKIDTQTTENYLQ